MSAPKFTPGPWEMIDGNIMTPVGILSVSGVSIPCGYVPNTHPSHANARLIAAAPDLLEALQRFIQAEDSFRQNTGAEYSYPATEKDSMAEAYDAVKAAIIKAEGGAE